MPAINLKQSSGLPLKLEGNKLIFGSGMEKIVPEARTRERMAPVLKHPEAELPKEFYYMYRDVCIERHRKKIRAANLRYDITVLPAFLAGHEYNKTFGHYHPAVPGTKTWYPEVYEVLHGRAHYLLQNGDEFLVFDAREGDKCVMLPGFGHITVNPSKTQTLVMANWVYPGFASDYGPIEKMHGGQWYETTDGFVENMNYGGAAYIKLVSPKKFPMFGLTEKPIYTEGVKKPKQFEWLWKPQDFAEQFSKYRET